MNTKDWVLLIVPIITNGILVYIFQYAFSIHIEKNARLRHNHYKIIEELHQQLSGLYNTCKLFADSISAKYESNVGNAFNQEILQYKELKMFYLTHKKILPEYVTSMEQICKEMENIHSELILIQENHNGIISSTTITATAEHHNKLVKILEQTMDKCGQELNSIYS